MAPRERFELPRFAPVVFETTAIPGLAISAWNLGFNACILTRRGIVHLVPFAWMEYSMRRTAALGRILSSATAVLNSIPATATVFPFIIER